MRMTLPGEERKAWTPVLDVALEDSDQGVLLNCQYGPDPGAWTAFMALYIGAVFLAFTGLMFGISQLALDQRPWALWALPATALLVLLLHVVARRGQRATGPQMEKLRSCLTAIVESAESSADREQPARAAE